MANGATSTSSVFHAFQFTVGSGNGGVLDEIVVGGNGNTSFTETFYIRSDVAGSRGSVIDTIAFTVIGDSVSRLYTGASTTHVTLTAGTSYWIEAGSPAAGNSFYWLQATPIVTSKEYSSATGYFTNQGMESFALLQAPTGVPEPATALVAAGGLAALGLLRRLRRRR